ncbi:MAG: hypothetical protein Udaeo2_10320 [Candidatus Udaeobacter sp.]|nr:MAG: hypothetical protein Udaeo2_10320 [Candidatus Udaeobacter sp.]
MHASVFHTQTTQIIQRLLLTQINQFAFQLRADDDCFSGKMVPRVLANRRDVLRGAVAWGVVPGIRVLNYLIVAVSGGGYRRQIRFRDVTCEDCRL